MFFRSEKKMGTSQKDEWMKNWMRHIFVLFDLLWSFDLIQLQQKCQLSMFLIALDSCHKNCSAKKASEPTQICAKHPTTVVRVVQVFHLLKKNLTPLLMTGRQRRRRRWVCFFSFSFFPHHWSRKPCVMMKILERSFVLGRRQIFSRSSASYVSGCGPIGKISSRCMRKASTI